MEMDEIDLDVHMEIEEIECLTIMEIECTIRDDIWLQWTEWIDDNMVINAMECIQDFVIENTIEWETIVIDFNLIFLF